MKTLREEGGKKDLYPSCFYGKRRCLLRLFSTKKKADEEGSEKEKRKADRPLR